MGVPAMACTPSRSALSRLIATAALFSAPAVAAHAQSTDWGGAFSSNWFLSGNWTASFPRQTVDGTIDTAARNSPVVDEPGAAVRNLTVGQSRAAALTIQGGGTLAGSFSAIGNGPTGQGSVTVTGPGSSWSTAGDLVVGGSGSGMVTVQSGGAVSSATGSLGQSSGSNGVVTVSGAGSSWTLGPGGGLNIGGFGTGTLAIADGGRVNNLTNAGANIGNAVGSQGAVTVSGVGSVWTNSNGVNVGNRGSGVLTVADGGTVNGSVTIAANAGSTGTLNIGAGGAPGTIAAPVISFGSGTGTINFNHNSTGYVFAPAISGTGAVNALAGVTILTGASSYSGPTTVSGGALLVGNATHPSATIGLGGPVSVSPGATIGGDGSITRTVTNSGIIAIGNAAPGFDGSPVGTFVITGDLQNQGLIKLAGSAPGNVLVVRGGYVGSGGAEMAINTVLAGDGSASDKLVISTGLASGTTSIEVTHVGGEGALTSPDGGIRVVEALDGGRTDPSAFVLAGPVIAGPYEYTLQRGSAAAGDDWFLRSTLDCSVPAGLLPRCAPHNAHANSDAQTDPNADPDADPDANARRHRHRPPTPTPTPTPNTRNADARHRHRRQHPTPTPTPTTPRRHRPRRLDPNAHRRRRHQLRRQPRRRRRHRPPRRPQPQLRPQPATADAYADPNTHADPNANSNSHHAQRQPQRRHRRRHRLHADPGSNTHTDAHTNAEAARFRGDP